MEITQMLQVGEDRLGEGVEERDELGGADEVLGTADPLALSAEPLGLSE